MSIYNWIDWAALLLVQNVSFTVVSRARNSGSLSRHIKAAVFSNGVWFLSQMVLFTTMFDNLRGVHGSAVQLLTGLYYVVFTVAGSVIGHFYALRTEDGKGRVGATDRYAQITQAEWDRHKDKLNGFAACMLVMMDKQQREEEDEETE